MASFPKPFFRWRPHPWHGLETGPQPPEIVTAFIEISPRDVVKYEVDKQTGYIKLDRLQRGSSSPPTLYGLIPRTYCAENVAALSPEVDVADGDPLDICVISERPIDRAEILITTRVLGGLRMIDGGEADDKIIAVVHQDPVWDGIDELSEVPPSVVERLTHYFLTYKARPGRPQTVTVPEVYGRAHGCAVIEASIADYQEAFGG
jgi:inorganic pyrophosphatase